MRKPEILQNNRTLAYQRELATLDFQSFVQQSGYQRFGHQQERFFLIDGKIPENVELIRFENLLDTFVQTVAPYVKSPKTAVFPNRNRTQYLSNIEDDLSEEVKELIYHKHKYMFDSGLYDRDNY